MGQIPARGRQELEAVLSKINGEPVVVLITGHPDPDALGSALALATLPSSGWAKGACLLVFAAAFQTFAHIPNNILHCRIDRRFL